MRGVCEAVWSVGTGGMRDNSEPAVAHCVKTLSGLNILSLIVVGFCILQVSYQFDNTAHD